jgi:hypothetical protein
MMRLPRSSRRGFITALVLLPAIAALSAGQAAAQQQRSPFTGVWKEFWSPDTETDVKYHDEAAIGVDAVGRAKVLMLSRDQTFFDEKIDGRTISFTLQTSFLVKYKLTLNEDGSVLEGEAETPNKNVNIRWERIR